MSEGRWVELGDEESRVVFQVLGDIGTALAHLSVQDRALDDVTAATRALGRVLERSTPDGPARPMLEAMLEGIRRGLDASDPGRN